MFLSNRRHIHTARIVGTLHVASSGKMWDIWLFLNRKRKYSYSTSWSPGLQLTLTQSTLPFQTSNSKKGNDQNGCTRWVVDRKRVERNIHTKVPERDASDWPTQPYTRPRPKIAGCASVRLLRLAFTRSPVWGRTLPDYGRLLP